MSPKKGGFTATYGNAEYLLLFPTTFLALAEPKHGRKVRFGADGAGAKLVCLEQGSQVP